MQNNLPRRSIRNLGAAQYLFLRLLLGGLFLVGQMVLAGNFYAGTSPATVPWASGIVPYQFTNTLTAAQQKTYLDGLREWELAANVKFVPHTNQTRWVLFTYNTLGINNVSASTNPQVVNISSLSRSQVGHEMGHSFGFQHENIRSDQTNFLTVLSNNVAPGNLPFLLVDPTTVTNGLGYTLWNVWVQNGATNNSVGGTGAGLGNVIAFAAGSGIFVTGTNTFDNSLRGNSIFSNGALGVDLVAGNDAYPGVTPDDTGDADSGPNNLQNFPVITNSFGYGFSTIVLGKLNSGSSRSFSIDVYRSLAADSSGFGEGQFYLGSVNVTTDGTGNAGFALTNSAANYTGQSISATATSATGDTSEFSAAVLATNKPAPAAAFAAPFQYRTNGFVFGLTFATNFSYSIQATTNLAALPIVWTDLTNFTATISSLTFTDRTATNFRTRFYRTVSP